MAVRENPPAWLQNYQQGEFKGAVFHVASIGGQFGRRTVTHEYPQRDKPFTEDLGRKAREFTIDAYLVGPDYQSLRNPLIAACESEGPGVLVHPYMGTLNVVCRGLAVRERSQDGGYCELSLTFVEDGENQFPAAVANPTTAVNDAADEVQDTASSVFETLYDISQMPEFVRTEMHAAADQLLEPLEGLVSLSTDFADSLSAFKRDLGSIIYQPRALAASFLNAINSVTSMLGANEATSAALHDMAVNVLKAVPKTTGTRTRQSDAQDAMNAMVQQMAAAEHARVVATQPYDSYQGALDQREQLTDEIDTLSETAPDEIFDTLQDLRAKVVQSLPDPRLPEIRTVTMRQATPALVLAYRIYGDPLRDADIVARNSIRHPGFIPGGSTVEVVVNG